MNEPKDSIPIVLAGDRMIGVMSASHKLCELLKAGALTIHPAFKGDRLVEVSLVRATERNYDGGHKFDSSGNFIGSKPIMMRIEEAQLQNILNRAREVLQVKVTYCEDEVKMLKEALHLMREKAEMLAVEFETLIRRQD